MVVSQVPSFKVVDPMEQNQPAAEKKLIGHQARKQRCQQTYPVPAHLQRLYRSPAAIDPPAQVGQDPRHGEQTQPQVGRRKR